MGVFGQHNNPICDKLVQSQAIIGLAGMSSCPCLAN